MQDKMFQNLKSGKITLFRKIFNFNLKTCDQFFKSTASVLVQPTGKCFLCDACYTMYISFIIFCNNIQTFKTAVF